MLAPRGIVLVPHRPREDQAIAQGCTAGQKRSRPSSPGSGILLWPGLPSLCSLTRHPQTQDQAGPYLVLVDQQLGLAEEQVAVFPEAQEAPAALLDRSFM